MPISNIKDGRIFISYRRSDAKGFAGRLSDSLESYFGRKRIFRDIEDIKGGAPFAEVIQKNIQTADAVIVLIGPTWLSVKEEDDVTPRILAPGDWVAQEIISAIELKIPLFPVLIGQTPMPRVEELPAKLHPILQYNAMTISDKNWQSDVLRLGRVLSFDIPSANERKIELAKTISSFSIFATLAFSSGVLFWNSLQLPIHYNNIFNKLQTEELKSYDDIFNQSSEWLHENGISVGLNSRGDKVMENFDLIELWQAGVPYFGIAVGGLLIFYIIPLIDQDHKKYLFASILLAAIGTFFILLLLLIFPAESEEAMWTYIGSIIIATGMLVFMTKSGFKAR